MRVRGDGPCLCVVLSNGDELGRACGREVGWTEDVMKKKPQFEKNLKI